MPARLALNFLGPPQIFLHDQPIPLERRKMVALLAFLAVEGGQHQRAALSALLWPDYEQSKAYKNLRQVLWEIQQAIGDEWLTVRRESIGLNETAEIDLDVAHFNTLVEQSRSQADVSLRAPLLSDAAKRYRHHFLSGFSPKDAQPFDDWSFAEAEELRQKLSFALTTLSNDYCSLGQAEQAIPHARRLAALDPLNEAAQRQLMEIYLQSGQHSAALKQYQTLEQTLRKEMNLDPQPETRELYKRIRKGEAKPVRVEKPVNTDSTPPHNLPHTLSSFIGRSREQGEVRKLLQKNRLVTLVGTGGIGKTSLSLQLGHALLHEYPDGVWFVALDSLSDPVLTVQTVASVFDIREDTERPLAGKLIEALRTRSALLILDNCEHLLDTCAQLVTLLLSHCPNLRVLATSREGLSVAGEAVYTMPSLPLPELGVDSLEQLTEYESVKLFGERASLALTSFQMTQDNIHTVVEICRKVDGIPLAIELAAARVNMLQVDEILNQLNDSFSLLAKNSRTIMPRQQTLRRSIEWSWNLLDKEEQRFLREASVFAGGWTLDAAQSVCTGDILMLTAALVKKSLIVVSQEEGRETRYRFHEMVREYAHYHCHAAADEGEFHTRHLRYFLDLSQKAELGLRGPSRVDWIERLDDELNNIRSALHHAARTDIESGLHLTSRLIRYWECSNLPEGDHWLKQFIDNPESNTFPTARARALLARGWLLTWLQKFNDAFVLTEESLLLFRTVGDLQGEADALVSLANIKQFKDDLDGAGLLLYESLTLAQSLHDDWREANVYFYLGWDRRDQPRALAYWDKAVVLYRKVGDLIALANLLGVSGQFHVLDGDLEFGEKQLEEAITLWQDNRRANMWQNPKIAKSVIASVRGDYAEARSLLEEALHSVSEPGNRMSNLWVRVRLGYAVLRAGELSEAREILTGVTQEFYADRYTAGTLFALEGMAAFFTEVGSFESASKLIGWADETRKKIHDPRPRLEQADVDRIMEICLANSGEVSLSECYEAGQSMTMDEAVSLALREN